MHLIRVVPRHRGVARGSGKTLLIWQTDSTVQNRADQKVSGQATRPGPAEAGKGWRRGLSQPAKNHTICLGFVFFTGTNLKDFLGSFSGSFRLTCVAFPFVFNNFSASFSKIRYLFLFSASKRPKSTSLYRVFSRPESRNCQVPRPGSKRSFPPAPGPPGGSDC